MLHLGVTTADEVLGVTRLAPGLSISSSEPLEEFDAGPSSKLVIVAQ